MTNPITADVWEGIRARHSLVESAGQPTEAARAMAYLSHLDRRDLIVEVERLRRLLSESVEVLRDLGDHANADEFEKQAGGPSAEPSVPWKCDWPGCTLKGWHGHAGLPPDYK